MIYSDMVDERRMLNTRHMTCMAFEVFYTYDIIYYNMIHEITDVVIIVR
jgi:hypothetical protein